MTNDNISIAKAAAILQVCTSCPSYENCSERRECQTFFDCYRCALIAIQFNEINKQLIDVNDL